MDKNYWEAYYSKDLAPHEPSQFATQMLEKLQKGKRLLELGCGNGRDSIFFSKNGLCVTAIDQAVCEIKKLHESYREIEFLTDDFVHAKVFTQYKFDYVYSRFTMHSITSVEQQTVLKNAYDVLLAGGLFFAEVRTVNDDIYGKGEPVGPHEYVYEGHYRRFVEKCDFEKSLQNEGFSILYSEERSGFSKTNQSDPVLLRVIAQKNTDM